MYIHLQSNKGITVVHKSTMLFVYMYILPVNLHISQFSAVTVGIEKPDYQVAEEAGSIQVCAVIRDPRDTSCPVNFSISVIFLTTDGSAGRANITIYTFDGMYVCGQLWFYVDIIYMLSLSISALGVF